MIITIVPSSPLVQTQTITTTVVSIKVTNVEFDLAENIVTFSYDSVDSNGIITSGTMALNQTDTTTFLATTATAGQTLSNLGATTAATFIQSKLSFTGTVVNQ